MLPVPVGLGEVLGLLLVGHLLPLLGTLLGVGDEIHGGRSASEFVLDEEGVSCHTSFRWHCCEMVQLDHCQEDAPT